MNEYLAHKEAEEKFLASEKQKNPEAFTKKPFTETPEYLRKFGITIPNQAQAPAAFLKLWPQDFIVEEIDGNGDIQNVNIEEDHAQGIENSEGQTIFGTLVKCKLQTSEAINELCRHFNLSPQQVQYAGLKDKDAITAQALSFHKTKTEITSLKTPHFVLKNIYKGKGGVTIGSLKGNRFTILARTTSPVNKTLWKENLERIEREGIYNFFYLQRFGSPRFMNFEWLLDILRGQHEKALLDFIGQSGERDIPYFQTLRQKICEAGKNWDAIEQIMTPLPLSFVEELKLVRHLKNNPEDFIGAWQQIPEQLTLWSAALSSYLFNQKISECLEKKIPLPAELPLVLSPDQKDWELYRLWLEEKNVFPPRFERLKSFHILLRKRSVPTKIKVEIHHYKIIPEGVVLSFSLPKGAYATTFFAHLFQLIGDCPPEDIQNTAYDTKQLLDEPPLSQTLEYFKPLLEPKKSEENEE